MTLKWEIELLLYSKDKKNMNSEHAIHKTIRFIFQIILRPQQMLKEFGLMFTTHTQV